MAVIKVLPSIATIGEIIAYVTKEEGVQNKEYTQISGIDCNPLTAKEEMEATIKSWKKTGGKEYDHYILSFDNEENVTSKQAHEIANKWAKILLKGHQCLIVTHVNAGYLHSHVIINSVNHENGKRRYRNTYNWKHKAKFHFDNICSSYGLYITENVEY